MKILNAEQIRQWDAYTIQHKPISSLNLMEFAAQQCTGWLLQQYIPEQPVKIFCGKGNNGGDGLAIARQLIDNNIHPSIYILEFGAKGTDDFQQNLQRLHEITKNIFFIQSEEFFPELTGNDLIIDALYGTGLNRPLENLSAKLVEYINQSTAKIISIDIPSGLFLDKCSVGNAVIKAQHTLSFQCYKLCFLAPENADYFGEITLLDIQLHPSFLNNAATVFEMVSPATISSIYKPRKNFSHKGTYGHALLVAGNTGKMGAAVLAAKACLRAGVGLLTCSVPAESLPIIQITLPEAMATTREEEANLQTFSTIGIGPGLATTPESALTLQHILNNYPRPMVIDADALNILAENNNWLQQVPKGSILSPHPKEFDRLFGKSNNDFERIDKAIQFSVQYPFTIILKGHNTLVANNGKGVFNNTGNAGLAKGGSGDILTGILTALLSQGYASQQAAVLGVYLHGLAADLAVEQDESYESLIPSDVIEHLGKAFHHISDNKKEVQE